MTEYKACSRCKQILPYEAFNKKASSPTGLNSACRECANAMKRNLTPEQRERTNQKKREWAKEHSDYIKQSNHEQYMANREARIIYANNWIEQNREKHAEYQKRNAYKHKVRNAGYSRRRRGKIQNNKSFYVSLDEEKKMYLSPCFACQIHKPDEMTIEHLIPVDRHGDDGIGNLVPMCQSCNSSKQNKTFMEWRVFRMKRGRPPLPAYAQITRAFRSLP